MMRWLMGLGLVLGGGTCLAHGTAGVPETADGERRIEFPDTDRYRTIVFDPHTHSVFSDGHVWPRIRIEEALRDGLDAIAITEHLEYQPHLEDIPHSDRNRAYDEAAGAAEGSDLMVIRGSEITRDAPAGHMNAIFIENANDLFRPPPQSPEPFDAGAYYRAAGEWPAQAAVQAANDQGAFVFWNHPYWSRAYPNAIPDMPDFHADNAANGLLHGIEIANGDSYSEETFQIALDHDLTLMGVSDVHDLIDWDYEPHNGGHRPVTLVLAEERTAESVREALFDQRTVVWFKNMLIGRPEHLEPLLAASLVLEGARYEGDSQILTVTLANHSDAQFELLNTGDATFIAHTDLLKVPPHAVVEFEVKTPKRVDHVSLTFDVLNALTAPKQNASITLAARVTADEPDA